MTRTHGHAVTAGTICALALEHSAKRWAIDHRFQDLAEIARERGVLLVVALPTQLDLTHYDPAPPPPPLTRRQKKRLAHRTKWLR